MAGIGAALVAIIVVWAAYVMPLSDEREVVTDEVHKPNLIELFEMSEQGVVLVEIQRNVTMASDDGLGSGIVYDTSGHIITNAHVVKDAVAVEVTFVDGRAYKADVVGIDHHTDLAVIYVDADLDQLQPLPVGKSMDLRVGEEVVAIGNPFGLSGSMTTGIVSQLDRSLSVNNTSFLIPDVIQTDTVINPGNSGGPLLNMMGEVIGVNTAIQSDTGTFTGVGFAVPSDTVSKIVPVLISQGQYEHPWIGVSGFDIDPTLAEIHNLTDTRGFAVYSVAPDSPAERAGLIGSNRTVEYENREYQVGGDIIVKIDDVEVRKINDILTYLQRSKSVGDEMMIEVLRNDTMMSLVLILDKRPDTFTVPPE